MAPRAATALQRAPLALLLALPAVAAACGGGGASGAVPGAQVPVELARDLWGVAHVRSATDGGAFFGAGYAAAEDRFLQMTLARLSYRGRLAEVLGPGEGGKYVDWDRRARLFGWRRHAEAEVEHIKLQRPELYQLLNAYAAGVNLYLKRAKSGDAAPLHPFFGGLPNLLAPLEVEPWSAVDSIGVWNRFGGFFQDFASQEIQLADAASKLADAGLSEAEIQAALFPFDVVDESAAAVQQDDVPPAVQLAMAAFAASFPGIAPSSPSIPQEAAPHFSQAWAVTGKRSSSGGNPGRAMLVGDPRIPLSAPNALYEWTMGGASFEARCVGVPGSPIPLVGSNSGVAWSVTAMAADQADLFRLTTDRSTTPWRYQVDGEWLSMEEEPEEVLVWSFADQEASPAVFDTPLVWRRTVFGPVLTAGLAPFLPEEYAIRAVPLDRPERSTHGAALDMLRARDTQEFRAALSAWDFPSVNGIYAGLADVRDPSLPDRVGYAAMGAQPLRAPLFLAGAAAQPGNSKDHLWVAYVPQELKPWVEKDGIDDDGVVFSANHLPVGRWYPLPRVAPALGHTERSRRLSELLGGSQAFSPEDLIQMHLDGQRPSARDVAELALALAQDGGSISSKAASVLPTLSAFLAAGGDLVAGTPGIALASFLPSGLLPDVPEHAPLVAQYGRGQSGMALFLTQTVAQRAAGVDLGPEVLAFLDAALAGAMDGATAAAGSADPLAQDLWYEASRLWDGIPIWLSQEGVDLAAGRLNHPLLLGVDGNTLLSQDQQSYTQVVDFGDPDLARSLLPPGVGEPGGATTHGADQIPLWAAGGLKPSPRTPEGLASAGGAESVQVLLYSAPPGS